MRGMLDGLWATTATLYKLTMDWQGVSSAWLSLMNAPWSQAVLHP